LQTLENFVRLSRTGDRFVDDASGLTVVSELWTVKGADLFAAE